MKFAGPPVSATLVLASALALGVPQGRREAEGQRRDQQADDPTRCAERAQNRPRGHPDDNYGDQSERDRLAECASSSP